MIANRPAAVVATLACLAALSVSATAATIRVPQDYATIQAAITASATGDVVLIDNGIYREQVTVPSSKKYLTIRGSGNTTLNGGFYISVHGLTVEHLRIIGGHVNYPGWPQPNGFSVGGGSTDLMIRHNILENFHGRAWEITYHTDGLRIVSNIIRNVSGTAYINGSSNVVLCCNYFEGPSTFAVATDRMRDFRMEYNTLVYPAGPVITPLDNLFVIVSNNFVRTPDNFSALRYYTVAGTHSAHAAHNWWGSTNGPRDTAGSVEVAPGDAHPGVSNLLNVEPDGQLGGWVDTYGAVGSGSDDIDYFPWADAPIGVAPGYATVTSAWVSLDYGPTNANDGHAWGVDAFSNVQDGVNAVWSGTVWVAAGTYRLTEQIYINKALRVEGVEGAARTKLQVHTPAWTSRVVFINHPSAVLSGFTISDGWTGGSTYPPNRDGGGVYGLSGTVENCIVSNNLAWSYGGGMWIGNAFRVRNSLIARNTAATEGGGLYIHSSSGIVQNCSIVENDAPAGGAIAVSQGRGFVQNSVVYFNTTTSGPHITTPGSAGFAPDGGVQYSCTPDDISAWGPGNVTGSPWTPNRGVYQLHTLSPGYNAGTNASWIVPGTTRDLAGRDRILFDRVDMGAYECPDLLHGVILFVH